MPLHLVVPHRVLRTACPTTLAAMGLLLLVFGRFDASTLAQKPPVSTIRPADLRAHAITSAKVVIKPGVVMENATIIMREGVIELVVPSDQVTVPPDVRIWPGDGLTVYAGLIEPALMVKPTDAVRSAGAHWNPRVNPELSMADQPAPDKTLRKDLRGLGFTVAAVYPNTGAMRGGGVVLALADETEHVTAYSPRAAMAMAFDYGGGRPGGPSIDEDSESGAYPGSLMGAIALIRQTLRDAQWHAACQRVWSADPSGEEPPIRADALVALMDVLNRNQPVLFEVSDELNALRAAKIAGEFNLNMMILGSGTEFRRLREIVDLGMPVIVPLDFPKRPEVNTVGQADNVSLRDLQTWEQAPTNARRLIRAAPQNTIALTTHKLKSRGEFPANLRSAIKHGLTEDEALAAVTTAPAHLMGLENLLGTVEPGKAANLVVVKGSLFDKEGRVRDTWINGRRYEVFSEPEVKLVGSGTITIEAVEIVPPAGEMKIDVDTLKSTVNITLPDGKTKVSAKKVVVLQDQISWVCDGRPLNVEGFVRFSGVIDAKANTITGHGEKPDGSTFAFTATITPKAQGDKDDEKKDETEKKPDDDGAKPQAAEALGVSGTWTLRLEEMADVAVTMDLKLDADGSTVTGSINVMGESLPISNGKFDSAANRFTGNSATPDGGSASIEATVTGDNMAGTITSPQFTGPFTGSHEGSGDGRTGGKEDKESPFEMPPDALVYPLGEYGLAEAAKPQNVLITNATIWTCGPQGIIQNGVVFVTDGKVTFVGSSESWENFTRIARMTMDFTTIDAAGKHITPGLIDCHSHTGISGGVNEWTHSNTAEVRIADCIDPDDIDWYRQLAGGLVAVNQLHGSANAIGGQNSVVKIKWGGSPADFPIADAIPGIKFALGENVKRTVGRYPNTRMGVETWIRDAFTAAREYKAQWDRYLALPPEQRNSAMPPRRDLEMDALVEVLEGKRLIHCHSYRQDEILMLIRVADDFGFTIGTFQHVLEGFKVADAIARHGAGASSFSDWWAYKMEVMDAIPYNGSLMRDVGVLVSFNSDSDELARRLNWDAAKAVRYGGTTPEEALKFVTINPAKQLRIDHRTGSLEKGKDADFVIWSGDPLSTYSRCEQTWIDGACMFSLEKDAALRQTIASERQRLIQKGLTQAHGKAAKPGETGKEGAASKPDATSDTQPEGSSDESRPQPRGRRPQDANFAWIQEQLRLGIDPEQVRPGVCGCDELGDHVHDHD